MSENWLNNKYETALFPDFFYNWVSAYIFICMDNDRDMWNKKFSPRPNVFLFMTEQKYLSPILLA